MQWGDDIMEFYRVLAIDDGYTVVREIARFWIDVKNETHKTAFKNVPMDWTSIKPLRLPTADELRQLRAIRDDVPADVPTVENH